MQPDETTTAILATLEAMSGGRLRRRDDLGTLIDLAGSSGRGGLLADLSFQARFLTRAFGIMSRIGRDGDGYGRLAAEFTDAMRRAEDLARALLAGAAEETRARFEASYLATTHEALQNRLALYHDLGWYKNWLIDRRSAAGGARA